MCDASHVFVPLTAVSSPAALPAVHGHLTRPGTSSGLWSVRASDAPLLCRSFKGLHLVLPQGQHVPEGAWVQECQQPGAVWLIQEGLFHTGIVGSHWELSGVLSMLSLSKMIYIIGFTLCFNRSTFVYGLFFPIRDELPVETVCVLSWNSSLSSWCLAFRSCLSNIYWLI